MLETPVAPSPVVSPLTSSLTPQPLSVVVGSENHPSEPLSSLERGSAATEASGSAGGDGDGGKHYNQLNKPHIPVIRGIEQILTRTLAQPKPNPNNPSNPSLHHQRQQLQLQAKTHVTNNGGTPQLQSNYHYPPRVLTPSHKQRQVEALNHPNNSNNASNPSRELVVVDPGSGGGLLGTAHPHTTHVTNLNKQMNKLRISTAIPLSQRPNPNHHKNPSSLGSQGSNHKERDNERERDRGILGPGAREREGSGKDRRRARSHVTLGGAQLDGIGNNHLNVAKKQTSGMYTYMYMYDNDNNNKCPFFSLSLFLCVCVGSVFRQYSKWLKDLQTEEKRRYLLLNQPQPLKPHQHSPAKLSSFLSQPLGNPSLLLHSHGQGQPAGDRAEFQKRETELLKHDFTHAKARVQLLQGMLRALSSVAPSFGLMLAGLETRASSSSASPSPSSYLRSAGDSPAAEDRNRNMNINSTGIEGKMGGVNLPRLKNGSSSRERGTSVPSGKSLSLNDANTRTINTNSGVQRPLTGGGMSVTSVSSSNSNATHVGSSCERMSEALGVEVECSLSQALQEAMIMPSEHGQYFGLSVTENPKGRDVPFSCVAASLKRRKKDLLGQIANTDKANQELNELLKTCERERHHAQLAELRKEYNYGLDQLMYHDTNIERCERQLARNDEMRAIMEVEVSEEKHAQMLRSLHVYHSVEAQGEQAAKDVAINQVVQQAKLGFLRLKRNAEERNDPNYQRKQKLNLQLIKASGLSSKNNPGSGSGLESGPGSESMLNKLNFIRGVSDESQFSESGYSEALSSRRPSTYSPRKTHRSSISQRSQRSGQLNIPVHRASVVSSVNANDVINSLRAEFALEEGESLKHAEARASSPLDSSRSSRRGSSMSREMTAGSIQVLTTAGLSEPSSRTTRQVSSRGTIY